MTADHCRKRLDFPANLAQAFPESGLVVRTGGDFQSSRGRGQGGTADEAGVGQDPVGGFAKRIEIGAGGGQFEHLFRLGERGQEKIDLAAEPLIGAVGNIFEQGDVDGPGRSIG